MATGRKTGGRNFKKGQGGRKKGAKDKVPRGRAIKASIKAVLHDVVAQEPKLIRQTIVRGFKAPPQHAFHYVQLAAHFLDGKPTETVRMLDVTQLSQATLDAIERDMEASDRKAQKPS